MAHQPMRDKVVGTWLPFAGLAVSGCATTADGRGDAVLLYGLLALLIGGTLGAFLAFFKIFRDERKATAIAAATARLRNAIQGQQPLVDVEAGPSVPTKRPMPDRVAGYIKPAFTPPPPPPAPPGSMRTIRPEDARLRESVAGASSFKAPNLRTGRPIRMKTNTTVEEEFEALEFKPGAILFEGPAIIEANGKTLTSGVLPFLEALSAAEVPTAFVVHEGPAHLMSLLNRYGPVVQGPPPLSPLLVQAAGVLHVPIEECAAILAGAASIRLAHQVECLTIGFSAQGAALALSQADLVVRRLEPRWVQPDGRFLMD